MLPRGAERFVAEYEAALDDARSSLELGGVHDVVDAGAASRSCRPIPTPIGARSAVRPSSRPASRHPRTSPSRSPAPRPACSPTVGP
ncbi:DUF6247 family protein [Actinomycetospora sp. CA-101289]|uniref:DUF6247 family protein n=1 Tax=Actinomycetospora sp. CA-101289 TaxID=3239893 RepID=UPI003D95B7D3